MVKKIVLCTVFGLSIITPSRAMQQQAQQRSFKEIRYAERAKQFPDLKALAKSDAEIPYVGPQVWDAIGFSTYCDNDQYIVLADEGADVVATFQGKKPFSAIKVLAGLGTLYGMSPIAIAQQWQLAAAFYKTIFLWDLQTNQQKGTLNGHENFIETVVYNPTDPNMLISGSDDTTVKVWDLRSEKCARTMQANQAVVCVDVNPQAGQNQCASVTKFANNALTFWDIGTGKDIKSGTAAGCVKYNKAGTQLATGLPGFAVLYDTVSFNQASKVPLPGMWTTKGAIPLSYDFSSDDSTVIMGGELWDIFIFDGKMTQIQNSFNSGMADVVVHYSSDNSQILSSGLFNIDGGTSVRIFTLNDLRKNKSIDSEQSGAGCSVQ